MSDDDKLHDRLDGIIRTSNHRRQDDDDVDALIEAIAMHNRNQKFSGKQDVEGFEDKPHELNLGHRARLKTRFLNAPRRALPDYEVLELILFYTIVRKDTKPLAKILLKKFGSLAGIVFADDSALKTIPGVGDGVLFFIKLLADFFSRLCVPQQKGEVHVLSSWLSVLNYCQLTMGFKKSESFRVLFLNKRNVLIADEFVDAGTIDKIAIYPREISKMALLHGASAIILVHNHPSGDPNPSREDVEITNRIIDALSPINVIMHDHVIVAEHNHFSFKAASLI
jgi:DNA repair protein RadC